VKRIFTSIAPIAITFGVGLVVLITYLTQDLATLRAFLIDIAIIVAGVALLMGFVHLLVVHWQRFRQRKNIYSLILILVAVITAGVLVLDLLPGSSHQLTGLVLDGIIAPAQSALGAMLTVFLAMAAFRLARRRSWGAVWFLMTAFVVLITQIQPANINQASPIFQFLSWVREIFDAVATGGMRGLLLGVALGTLAVAFRVLLAIDRPQSE
jgi:hypothetical protein